MARLLLLAGAVAFSLFSTATAQTVRPLIDENRVSAAGRVAKGRIEYYNDSLESLFVTLEPRSFTVSETGELSYRPLDPDIHLKLSTMSFRIPPQQSFYVFYEASTDKIPNWFLVYAAFSGFKARTAQGFKIQINLPHTIYILPKQTLQKSELQILSAQFDPAVKKVHLRVQNSGPAFGRVLETDIDSHSNHVAQDGFAVFPNAARQLDIAWPSSDDPSKIKLQLENFSLEHDVQSSTP